MNLAKKIINIGIYLVVFLIFSILVVYATLHLTTKSHIFNDISEIPRTEVAVIMGASIFKNGKLSPILTDRVDMAIKLYESRKVDKILATGDNSSVAYNEVNPVRTYLLEKGIRYECRQWPL